MGLVAADIVSQSSLDGKVYADSYDETATWVGTAIARRSGGRWSVQIPERGRSLHVLILVVEY